VRAPTAMHECGFPVPGHSPARTGAATRTGVSQHPSICSRPATEKESGSVVRRIEKSDRAASSAPAEIEICAGTVLPGSGSTEPQAPGAVPQPTDKTHSGSYRLKEPRGRKTQRQMPRKKPPLCDSFSTPTPCSRQLMVSRFILRSIPRRNVHGIMEASRPRGPDLHQCPVVQKNLQTGDKRLTIQSRDSAYDRKLSRSGKVRTQSHPAVVRPPSVPDSPKEGLPCRFSGRQSSLASAWFFSWVRPRPMHSIASQT